MDKSHRPLSFYVQIYTIKMKMTKSLGRCRCKYVHFKTHWAPQVNHASKSRHYFTAVVPTYYGKISFKVLVQSLLAH